MTVGGLPFAKYHGCGNDYILVDHAAIAGRDLAALACAMSNRHTGVGGDGLIAVELLGVGPARARMHMFNADGSRGMMCGNGIRLVGKFLGDEVDPQARGFRVETDAGPRDCEVFRDARGLVCEAEVDMGRAEFLAADPLEIVCSGRPRRLRCLSLGNPHAVCLADGPPGRELESLAAELSGHPAFPDGVNVGWLERDDEPGGLRLVVHERGSGRTLACGTGAAAAYAAARAAGWVGAEARVAMPGGTLRLRDAADDHIRMRGPAVLVFRGSWSEA